MATGALGAAQAGSPDVFPLEKCGVIANVNGKERSVVLPSLHVLQATAKLGPFVLPADAPQHVLAIQCGRRSLIPAENDYKVLQAGFPLYIVSHGRMLVMEVSDGQLQIRTVAGRLSSDEIPLIQAYLNKAQEYFYINAPISKN